MRRAMARGWGEVFGPGTRGSPCVDGPLLRASARHLQRQARQAAWSERLHTCVWPRVQVDDVFMTEAERKLNRRLLDQAKAVVQEPKQYSVRL